MSTITWLGVVIIIAASSFFLGGWFTKKRFKQEELEEQAQTAQRELEQYRQDVADHLDNTNKLISKLKDNYEQLANHVQQSDHLLLAKKNIDMSQPFFSKETTEQLHASLSQRPERHGINTVHDSQPADYAAGESGLFSGQKKETEQQPA
ncbi:ZapG family protein [Pseudoalteromonas sp. SSDWG2]|uniref:ZapG family protein n=1 Tax=Pseudoalteromonas sp. SSDWG2 TaxID=3139391 RepID=UPI003BAD1971